MIGSQGDGINGKLIKSFTTILTASQHPGVQRGLDTSFVICQFCKTPCSLITVDDGWAAPLPGAVLSHCCGQPHYGPDLIIRVQSNIRWGENGPTAGGTRQTINGSLEMFRSRSMWWLSIHRPTFIEISRKWLETLRRKWEAGEVWPKLCVLASDIPMSLPTSSDHSAFYSILIGQAPGLLYSRAHLLAPLEPLTISCYTRPGSNPRLIRSLSRNQIVFTRNNWSQWGVRQ